MHLKVKKISWTFFTCNIILYIFCLLTIPNANAQQGGSRVVSGTVVDKETGEQLIGAIISTPDGIIATATNAYGYFSLTLPAEVLVVNISSTSYETRQVLANSDTKIIKLKEASATKLKEVTISASGGRLRNHVKSTQMGLVDLPMSLLKKVPAIAGEVDIIKALQLTPGVKRGAEGTIGMFVRGGNIDENLILLDEATVYNAGHLLGFFSVFNSGSLKDVQLYKSSFPAQYGGRLSSIMDVRMKEGNMNEYHAEGSLGIISSNLTVEGPLAKDKASFIVSARRTYIDVVSFKTIPYHFYDLNGKLNYIIDPQNRVYLSGYKGDDVLSLDNRSSDPNSADVSTNLKLGNATASLRWNHIFKDAKLFSNVSLVYTRFRYDVAGAFGDNSLLIASSIRDYGAKADFSYQASERSKWHFGATLTNHFFNPNIINTTGLISQALKEKPGAKIYNNEFALYANNDFKLNDVLQLNLGLRYTGIFVQSKIYSNPEPRVAARYLINERNSIKMSYARMAQYMHLVASSSVALPTDLWYPVTARIAPGISDQVSAGYFYSIPKLGIALSAETYYKWLQHQIEYREGAVLLLNDDYENELVTGKGTAYGLELFASRTSGRLSGWVGYSLSYSKRKFEELNNGESYFSKYDRRNDISVVAAYDLDKRNSFASTFVYSSGSPFTAQVSQYIAPTPSFTGIELLPVYGARNAQRLSASVRFDVDYARKFTIRKKIKSELHISCYNLLNRVQPSRVTRTLDTETGSFKYEQRGLFGAIPSISLNFKF